MLRVRHQPIGRVDELKPGDRILDGRVTEIRPLGEIPAVRLWTKQPAWLRTADGIHVGTRWHETGYQNGWWAWSGDRFAVTMPDLLPHLKVMEYSPNRWEIPPAFEGPCGWREALGWVEWQTDPGKILDHGLANAMMVASVEHRPTPEGQRELSLKIGAAVWRQVAGRFNPMPEMGLQAIRRDAADGTGRGLAIAV